MDNIHQKHTKIVRPDIGQFARNELAILGTPCGDIKKLAKSIITLLSKEFKTAYVDADHKGADDASNFQKSSLSYGNALEYVDKIDFHRFDEIQTPTSFDYKKKFNDQDLVLVNGNHFEANQQIVVIDERKTLEKKLHKLTNVSLILFQENSENIPSYLNDHIPEINNIPTLHIQDTTSIVSFISEMLKSRKPEIKGLVLAGGRSTRMKRDKSEIEYFGKSHKEHMFDLLSNVSKEAFYSIRLDQQKSAMPDEITDTFTGLGPYGAILSAFRHDPNAAWLITACDQPFITKETLELLISKRNTSKVATAFYNPETEFPEPLITLWEPRAYSHLLHFLSLGYSCPRKVLINTDIELVHLEDPTALKNVNTPEEYEEVLKIIN